MEPTSEPTPPPPPLPGGALILDDLHGHLMCHLCKGYLIDATAVVECLHTFCRSCILRHLSANSYCPVCDVMIQVTKGATSLRSDRTLQTLVYKLVPGLFDKEMASRRQFYAEKPYADPELPEWAKGDEKCFVPRVFSAKDTIHLRLDVFPDDSGVEDTTATSPRYVRCPAAVPLSSLHKLLRAKFQTPTTVQVQLILGTHVLPDDLTLLDLRYMYPNQGELLHLYYRFVRIRKRPIVSPNLKQQPILEASASPACKHVQDSIQRPKSKRPRLECTLSPCSNGVLSQPTSDGKTDVDKYEVKAVKHMKKNGIHRHYPNKKPILGKAFSSLLRKHSSVERRCSPKLKSIEKCLMKGPEYLPTNELYEKTAKKNEKSLQTDNLSKKLHTSHVDDLPPAETENNGLGDSTSKKSHTVCDVLPTAAKELKFKEPQFENPQSQKDNDNAEQKSSKQIVNGKTKPTEQCIQELENSIDRKLDASEDKIITDTPGDNSTTSQSCVEDEPSILVIDEKPIDFQKSSVTNTTEHCPLKDNETKNYSTNNQTQDHTDNNLIISGKETSLPVAERMFDPDDEEPTSPQIVDDIIASLDADEDTNSTSILALNASAKIDVDRGRAEAVSTSATDCVEAASTTPEAVNLDKLKQARVSETASTPKSKSGNETRTITEFNGLQSDATNLSPLAKTSSLSQTTNSSPIENKATPALDPDQLLIEEPPEKLTDMKSTAIAIDNKIEEGTCTTNNPCGNSAQVEDSSASKDITPSSKIFTMNTSVKRVHSPLPLCRELNPDDCNNQNKTAEKPSKPSGTTNNEVMTTDAGADVHVISDVSNSSSKAQTDATVLCTAPKSQISSGAVNFIYDSQINSTISSNLPKPKVKAVVPSSTPSKLPNPKVNAILPCSLPKPQSHATVPSRTQKAPPNITIITSAPTKLSMSAPSPSPVSQVQNAIPDIVPKSQDGEVAIQRIFNSFSTVKKPALVQSNEVEQVKRIVAKVDSCVQTVARPSEARGIDALKVSQKKVTVQPRMVDTGTDTVSSSHLPSNPNQHKDTVLDKDIGMKGHISETSSHISLTQDKGNRGASVDASQQEQSLSRPISSNPASYQKSIGSKSTVGKATFASIPSLISIKKTTSESKKPSGLKQGHRHKGEPFSYSMLKAAHNPMSFEYKKKTKASHEKTKSTSSTAVPTVPLDLSTQVKRAALADSTSMLSSGTKPPPNVSSLKEKKAKAQSTQTIHSIVNSLANRQHITLTPIKNHQPKTSKKETSRSQRPKSASANSMIPGSSSLASQIGSMNMQMPIPDYSLASTGMFCPPLHINTSMAGHIGYDMAMRNLLTLSHMAMAQGGMLNPHMFPMHPQLLPGLTKGGGYPLPPGTPIRYPSGPSAGASCKKASPVAGSTAPSVSPASALGSATVQRMEELQRLEELHRLKELSRVPVDRTRDLSGGKTTPRR